MTRFIVGPDGTRYKVIPNALPDPQDYGWLEPATADIPFTIRSVGQIRVSPPGWRKRWLGLRRERIPESVEIIGWWIEGGDMGMPRVFQTYWKTFVAEAIRNRTYFDYREGTEAFGSLPEGFSA